MVTRDRQAHDLLLDFTIIKEMAEKLAAPGPHGGRALAVANQIINVVVLGESGTYAAGRTLAQEFLSVRNGERHHRISAIGHAHIDTAWLWPLAETKRKCYRSFSSAVRLMDEYPEYRLVCSQAQQLAWVKEGQPALYAKIKEKVRQGQFVPAGGTWIEPDCNMPSGVTRPPVPDRSTLFQAGIRRLLRGVLEPGCLWLFRRAAPDHPWREHPFFS